MRNKIINYAFGLPDDGRSQPREQFIICMLCNVPCCVLYRVMLCVVVQDVMHHFQSLPVEA